MCSRSVSWSWPPRCGSSCASRRGVAADLAPLQFDQLQKATSVQMWQARAERAYPVITALISPCRRSCSASALRCMRSVLVLSLFLPAVLQRLRRCRSLFSQSKCDTRQRLTAAADADDALQREALEGGVAPANAVKTKRKKPGVK